MIFFIFFFFFQAEDGIRDSSVTGVQTCALPIFQVYLSCDADEASGSGRPSKLEPNSADASKNRRDPTERGSEMNHPELQTVAKRVVWFKSPGDALKDLNLFLAHVVTYRTLIDITTTPRHFS